MVPDGQAHATGGRGPEAKGDARGSEARSRSPPRVREIEIIFSEDKKTDGASEASAPEYREGAGLGRAALPSSDSEPPREATANHTQSGRNQHVQGGGATGVLPPTWMRRARGSQQP